MNQCGATSSFGKGSSGSTVVDPGQRCPSAACTVGTLDLFSKKQYPVSIFLRSHCNGKFGRTIRWIVGWLKQYCVAESYYYLQQHATVTLCGNAACSLIAKILGAFAPNEPDSLNMRCVNPAKLLTHRCGVWVNQKMHSAIMLRVHLDHRDEYLALLTVAGSDYCRASPELRNLRTCFRFRLVFPLGRIVTL